MFIALLVPQVAKPVYLMMAVLAAILSVTLCIFGFSQSHVIVATVVASTVGLGVEQWMNRSSS
jgi:predicted branched-subunit amino acid permease